MKKYFALLFIAIVLLIPVFRAQAVDPVIIEVFKSEYCPHCKKLSEYLQDLEKERDDFVVIYYDVNDADEGEFFDEMADTLGVYKVTPLIFINQTVITGFGGPDTSGQQIIRLIEEAKTKDSVITIAEYFGRELKLSGGDNQSDSTVETDPVSSPDMTATDNPDIQKVDDDETEGVDLDEISTGFSNSTNTIVSLPFIGSNISIDSLSLPTMSFVLGIVDGFNPCAMWVLVLLLGALVAVGNKKRMWEIAGLFLLAQAIMYYLILNVWLYAWDFIGLDRIITPIIGVVAVGAGIYFLWEFKKATDECKITDLNQRAKIAKKVQEFAQKPITLVTAVGIIGLALSVNIFEFACSIGIPQTFTKILDINELSGLTKQFYNLLYLIGYMIDDLVVFGIALYSFEKIGLTGKYTRWSHLIGGLLMVLLGLILLLKPDILVF